MGTPAPSVVVGVSLLSRPWQVPCPLPAQLHPSPSGDSTPCQFLQELVPTAPYFSLQRRHHTH